MQSVCITGGGGYIGSRVTALLLAAGYQVRVFDLLLFGGSGIRSFISHPNFEYLKGDIRNAQEVSAAMQGVDAVIHLAAIVGEPACNQNPSLAREVNAYGSSVVLEQAIAAKVKRFVFASTCSNYGRMEMKDGWVDETSRLDPISLYATTKVGFELELLRNKRDSFVPVILRFATAYGLSNRPRFDLTVNEFAAMLASGKQLEIYGEQFWRPYCHVDDIAVACQLAIEADTQLVNGEAFNVGTSSENYQKGTLVELVLRQLPEAKHLVRFVERDTDPRDYRVNCDKIKNRLGFTAKKTVSDGIREIIATINSGSIADFTTMEYRNA